MLRKAGVVCDGWYNSPPGHKDNMLNQGFTRGAIACRKGGKSMFKKVLATGLMITVMLSASACGKEPGGDSGSGADVPVEFSAAESQPTEEETKDSTAEDTQSTGEATEGAEGETSWPTEEAEEEAACSYIFSDMPIAAFEITGLGVGLDVPVCEEHFIDPEYGDDYGVIPFVQLTPDENTFVLYCFSGGSDSDEGWYHRISRSTIHSPSESGPWEANRYVVGGVMAEEVVPEGWAFMEKYYGEFSEQDAGRHEVESYANGFYISWDEPGNGEFLTLVDPWGNYIEFSEIFHSDASQPDTIHVVEIVTFAGGEEYEVEENVISAMVATFERRGATVQEISVEEALARDHIIVSEEGA